MTTTPTLRPLADETPDRADARRRAAAEWRFSPKVAREILAAAGFDADEIRTFVTLRAERGF